MKKLLLDLTFRLWWPIISKTVAKACEDDLITLRQFDLLTMRFYAASRSIKHPNEQ